MKGGMSGFPQDKGVDVDPGTNSNFQNGIPKIWVIPYQLVHDFFHQQQ